MNPDNHICSLYLNFCLDTRDVEFNMSANSIVAYSDRSIDLAHFSECFQTNSPFVSVVS